MVWDRWENQMRRFCAPAIGGEHQGIIADGLTRLDSPL